MDVVEVIKQQADLAEVHNFTGLYGATTDDIKWRHFLPAQTC